LVFNRNRRLAMLWTATIFADWKRPRVDPPTRPSPVPNRPLLKSFNQMEVDRKIVALGEKRVRVGSQLAAELDPLFLGGGMQQRQVKAEGRGALCLQ